MAMENSKRKIASRLGNKMDILGRMILYTAPCPRHANNKGANQPADPRSLFSAFGFCCLNSIISLVSIHVPTISRLYLVDVAEQTGLSLTWSQTPKTGFLVTRLIYYRDSHLHKSLLESYSM